MKLYKSKDTFFLLNCSSEIEDKGLHNVSTVCGWERDELSQSRGHPLCQDIIREGTKAKNKHKNRVQPTTAI
jgi:hypothetical protein